MFVGLSADGAAGLKGYSNLGLISLIVLAINFVYICDGNTVVVGRYTGICEGILWSSVGDDD